jgi:hypothetical protein
MERIEISAKLFQVVGGLRPSRSLARLLHSGKKQCDQNGDDGYYYEEFDEREPGTLAPGFTWTSGLLQGI